MNTMFSSQQSIIIAVIAFISVLGLWSYTQASGTEITACLGKNGDMYIVGQGFKRATCSNNETPISWNIQGPQGPKGDKGDQGAPGINGMSLHVFDANQQDVGVLVKAESTFGQPFTVYVPSAGVLLEMIESNGAVVIANTGDVIFSESDCKGIPYSADINPGSTLVRDGRVFKTIEGPLVDLRNASILGTYGCTNVQDAGSNLAPMTEVTLPFTLPLAWPLELRQG